MKQKVGINYPITKGDTGFFNQTYDSLSTIKSDLNVLLKTMFGERPFNPEMGLYLQKYVFEQMTDDLKDEITSEIEDKINRFLPLLEIQNINIDFNGDLNGEDINRNIIKIDVDFLYNNELNNISVTI